MTPDIAKQAREALLLITRHAAGSAGAPSPIAHRARSGWACNYVAHATTDSDLVDLACASGDQSAMYLAEVPALGAGGIAYKLAQLVSDLLQDFDGYPSSVQNLALAASALADAVVLAEGPITLPIGALAGVPEGDLATAKAWIARQDAATGLHRRDEAPR